MSPASSQAIDMPVLNANGQSSLPQPPERVQMKQPKISAPMDPQRPHAEDEEMTRLRGGERSSCCPGRFCFIIPCPLPCDCCII